MKVIKRASLNELSTKDIKGPTGYQLPVPKMVSYETADGLWNAVKALEDTITPLEAGWLKDLDINGNVNGTDLRMSRAAFGDLCHATGLPVSYIKTLAQENESLAADTMAHMIQARFQAKERLLIINQTSRVIEGIVSADVYAPVKTRELLESLQSAGPGLSISRGWVEGTKVRATLTSPDLKTEPQVGDVVQFGLEAINSMDGKSAVTLTPYNLRLVCTNGMRTAQSEDVTRIEHRGDPLFEAQKAALGIINHAYDSATLMGIAATQFLDAAAIKGVRKYVVEADNGGGNTVEKAMVEFAPRIATEAGREKYEVSLWDMVNGITEYAHESTSIAKRQSIESLAYRTLAEFAAI